MRFYYFISKNGHIYNISSFYTNLVLIEFILQFVFLTVSSLHLKGTFQTNEFFKFITRFGFQATDLVRFKQT